VWRAGRGTSEFGPGSDKTTKKQQHQHQQHKKGETSMDLTTIQSDQVLDTCGLTCPMPLLKTKKTLKAMKPGQVLEILGNDPGSKNDIPDWGNKGGNEFIGMEDVEDGTTRYFIKKG